MKGKIKNGKRRSVADITIDSLYLNSRGLTSLEGSPQKVKSFYVSNNKLKNLIEGPTEVEEYYASYNRLEKLKGAPKKVRLFCVSNNKLKNLIEGPKRVNQYYAIYNRLETLEGAPSEVDIFDIRYNPTLKNTNGIPKKIKALFVQGTIHSASQFTEYPEEVKYIYFDDRIPIEDVKEIISNMKEVQCFYINGRKYTKDEILKIN